MRTFFSSSFRTLPAWEWGAMVAVFLLAGIVSHDPWTGDEAYGFGVIYHYYTTGTWLVPTNAGLPFMEKSPLYYWTAAIFCHLFEGLLPLHDAARLAIIPYIVLCLVFLWKTSQVLFTTYPDEERRALGWITLSLFLGSLGMVRYVHEMTTDVAFYTGTTIALYGISVLLCVPERWRSAGLWMGVGAGVAIMSKGFLVPAILGMTGIALLVLIPSLRSRNTLMAIGIATLALLPFLLWPVLLYFYAYPQFVEWFWNNNVGRFLGFSVGWLGAANRPFYFVENTPWFAFPAFPLAMIGVLTTPWRQWRTPAFLLPFLMIVMGMTLLFNSASGRVHYLLPLFSSFVLLAAPALLRLPARFLMGWNGLVRLLFSVMIIGVWGIWWSIRIPGIAIQERPFPFLAEFADRWISLDYTPGAQPIACIMAVAITLFWLASFRLNTRDVRHTAYIWLVGIAAVWSTIFTLLLPWLDHTKSHRLMLESLKQTLDTLPEKNECMDGYWIGESIPSMIQYWLDGRIVLPLELDEITCPIVLALQPKNEPPDREFSGWEVVWKGQRLKNNSGDEFRLYVHRHNE